MIKVSINSREVRKMLATYPKQAKRALEISLDKTAYEIRDAVKSEMKRVFDRPTPYTLNSLKVTRTKNHNMKAYVWFKDPERMSQHYLVPQVEGGTRKYKGFERALGDQMFVPGKGAKMTPFGNIQPGQIRQILSVLKLAERAGGYQANITAKSAKRNSKQRDFVYLMNGSGKLPPGIYERVATTKRVALRGKNRKFGEYQRGVKSKAVRARGLKPVMLHGRNKAPVRPRLPFYETAQIVYGRVFIAKFRAELARRLP